MFQLFVNNFFHSHSCKIYFYGMMSQTKLEKNELELKFEKIKCRVISESAMLPNSIRVDATIEFRFLPSTWKKHNNLLEKKL